MFSVKSHILHEIAALISNVLQFMILAETIVSTS